MAYNRGVLEIMSPGPLHEDGKNYLRRMVEILTEELHIPCKCYGSTTWKRDDVERGIEPDECYYLTAAKVAAAHESKKLGKKDSTDYPAPDLAIEIDIRPSAVDRAEIYATLGVPEVWRFDCVRFRIDRLGPDGRYTEAEASLFLPISPPEIVHWLLLDAEDDNDWARQLREWMRSDLIGR